MTPQPNFDNGTYELPPDPTQINGGRVEEHNQRGIARDLIAAFIAADGRLGHNDPVLSRSAHFTVGEYDIAIDRQSYNGSSRVTPPNRLAFAALRRWSRTDKRDNYHITIAPTGQNPRQIGATQIRLWATGWSDKRGLTLGGAQVTTTPEGRASQELRADTNLGPTIVLATELLKVAVRNGRSKKPAPTRRSN